jgi:hypothetical protein
MYQIIINTNKGMYKIKTVTFWNLNILILLI